MKTLVFLISLMQLLLGQTNSSKMVLIKGGQYVPIYSTDSQKVVVKSFYMDVYPVTNGDYLKFTKKFKEWQKGL